MRSLLWTAIFQMEIFCRDDRVNAEQAACHLSAGIAVAESRADDVTELDYAAATETRRCVHLWLSIFDQV